MQPLMASLMLPDLKSADERKLSRIFRALDGQSRQTLLNFAEFLASRSSDAGTIPDTSSELASRDPVAPSSSVSKSSLPVSSTPGPSIEQPVWEPRPAQESVIAAIKRLRRTYPMLDAGSLLNDTSSLMAEHVLKGRFAEAVIDDLEALFAEHFDQYCGNLQ